MNTCDFDCATLTRAKFSLHLPAIPYRLHLSVILGVARNDV